MPHEDNFRLRGGSVGLLTAGFLVMPGMPELLEFNPAYVPAYGSALPDEMGFWERLANLASSLAIYRMRRAQRQKVSAALASAGLPAQPVPAVHAGQKGTGMFLSTNHWGYEYPVYHSPAVQLIGSLTAEEGKPLHGELGRWMETSGVPVIVICLGSTTFQSEDAITAFAAVIRELSAYRIVWKLKTEAEMVAARNALPGTEHRVWIDRWLPFNDLLAHEDTVLAVVHCGNSGMNEVMFHGVPFVGVPQMIDQVMTPP